jgi:hypothetical protein
MSGRDSRCRARWSVRALVLIALPALLGSSVPVVASVGSDQHIDVRLTDSGPWIAYLVNFDFATVMAVTYYIRDANQSWRQTESVKSAPFEAPINWWEGANNGDEAVTAHVTLESGQVMTDPGGWQWIDGYSADPKGSIQAWTNRDGTPGALYAPDSHTTDIKGVEFWFRDSNDHWHDVGPGTKTSADADWAVQSFEGIPAGWKGSEDAVSIHVVWPGGQQLADPTGWATDFSLGPLRVGVRLTDSGPWIAHLTNIDQYSVLSVTYYVRDASENWRRLQPVTSPPFEAPINWWEGANDGTEVVTAHVALASGQVLTDPGGWHRVDGREANPKGTIQAWTNQDGTPGALYTPAAHVDDMKVVEFWFRDAIDQWHDVGPGSRSADDADWLIQTFKGITAGWEGSEDAVSVHVIWAGGQQLVDPTNWATDFTSQSDQPIATRTGTAVAKCGDPHAHVYSPDRLRLLAPCVSVTGVIDAIRTERDGDLHVLLRLDPGQARYVNAKNALEEGDLVLEPVCVNQPTQADAVSACSGYTNPLTIPPQGAHVSVTGAWVLDLDHGWLEIHPVSSFGPPADLASAPSPASASPAPPADPYATLRAQGVSAICNDGTYSYSRHRSGTCSHHGGVRVWTGLI